jgi:hypothetical protein
VEQPILLLLEQLLKILFFQVSLQLVEVMVVNQLHLQEALEEVVEQLVLVELLEHLVKAIQEVLVMVLGELLQQGQVVEEALEELEVMLMVQMVEQQEQELHLQ